MLSPSKIVVIDANGNKFQLNPNNNKILQLRTILTAGLHKWSPNATKK